MKKILVALALVSAVVLAPTGVQAAVNYFDQTQIVTAAASYPYVSGDPANPNTDYPKVATVSCPRGWKVTGGGYVLPDDTNNTVYWVQSSYPVNSRTWGVVGHIYNDFWTGPRVFYPQRYAVCVK